MHLSDMKINHKITQYVESQIQRLKSSTAEKQPCSQLPYQQGPQVMLQILQQYQSGLKAISCLLEHGFVAQTRGIFQTLGDDYEDIIFLSLPCLDGELTALHKAYLKGVTNNECQACYSPVSRCEIRSTIKQAKTINHNVFQLYPKKQALQVLRPQGSKPCSATLAVSLHRYYAHKALLLAMLTAKVSGVEEVMRACLNYRAHLEMSDELLWQRDIEEHREAPTKVTPQYASA
ncbi:hypothetical protein A3K86_19250 [Photobacterium jeanii]|uniref:Uncharacterized protein n=1 Tax=Photobacterium jeanii TaxID=858640 RepID=A0A178K1A0_9GAMM|nr:hypothetical protein [Photobacterium jeanii]OAN11109.1 hypothetical protein A3K86_19250 [Photobacterium jeanii]PST90624.1 hypothetical protein C9I91_08350 [Photobacterium jeanii]